MINSLPNIISLFQGAAFKGPVLVSQGFDRELMATVEVIEFEVSNKSKIPEGLPFGLIAQITNRGNINKARMLVRVGPGFYLPSGVEWPELCTREAPSDGELVSVTVCTKVVPIGTQIEEGEGIYSSVVTPIDDRHALRVTKKHPVVFRDQEYVVTREDVVPARFKALRGTEEFSETVVGTAVKPLLAVGDELKAEQQISPTAKRITTKKLGENTNDTLEGTEAYIEGVKANTTDALLNVSEPAATGLQVIKSTVEELGNGQFIKSTAIAPSWPVFRGSRLDERLGVGLSYTEQMVAPPAVTGGIANVEFVPVNEHRTLRRETQVPTEFLESYKISHPVRVSMQLPKVFKGVRIVWNEAGSAGDQESAWNGYSVGKSYALSCNLGDQSSGTAAATPEVILDIEEIWASNLPAVAHFCYMKLPITEAQILAKFGAIRWPVFKPKSRTIVCIGQKAGVAVNVSINASSSGSETSKSQDAGKSASANFDVSINNNVIQIGPTINAGFAFSGETSKQINAQASASMACSGNNFPTVSVNKSAGISVTARVEPQSFEATQGAQDIPRSGLYLIDSRIEVYKWGYAAVYVELLNAGVFA